METLRHRRKIGHKDFKKKKEHHDGNTEIKKENWT